jgi:hypothetical protein
VRARRLVEAGVPFVSMQVGLWDHHCADGLPTLFESYRSLLPLYDNCLSALITDLHERGLHEDVCVVVWGEFGRTPGSTNSAARSLAGSRQRALLGRRVENGTIRQGDQFRQRVSDHPPLYPAEHPGDALSCSWDDPSATIPDHNGRPQYLLEDREPVKELI